MSARDLRQQCIDWRSAQEGNDRDDALIVVKVGQVEALLDIAESADTYRSWLGQHHWRCEYRTVAMGWKHGEPPIIKCVCGLDALEAALARLDAIRTTDTSPLTLGASATVHDPLGRRNG